MTQQPQDELFTKDQALGGITTAKRAYTILFLIESRVAHLAMRSQQAMERFLSDETERKRDLAFYEAFALGREPPLRPTIQDLERFAPQWAELAPERTDLRAALAHVLGGKYIFTRQATPRLRAALGLDSEAVQAAYQRLYGQPLGTIYAARMPALKRAQWAWSALSGWLESLPPFWTVYAVALTETVGAGILALPIAMASVGPLAGVVLLVILGLVNTLTVAAIAESIARTSSMRYGNAFFGRLVSEYLGRTGSLILILALVTFLTTAQLAYYIGFARVLTDATGIHPVIWAAGLFLICLYFLSRGSLSSTVASSLAIGVINILLILALAALALTRLDIRNLTYVNIPFLNGRSFDPSLLELIFGVVLLAYFGHSSVGNCSRLVLQRDPSARSLIWGVVAAQLTAIVLYCLWIVAVNGAIAPQVLAAQPGTSLEPLAALIGPSVHALGSIFVALGMGMASIHTAISLRNIVEEHLPAPAWPILLLTRQRERLILFPAGKPDGWPRLALTYLGLERNRPHFNLELQRNQAIERLGITCAPSWDAGDLLKQSPDPKAHLRLDVLDSSQEHVRVQVSTSFALRQEGMQQAPDFALLDALGNSASESDVLGSSASESDVLGSSASESDVLGNSASESDVLGSSASESDVLGSSASESVALESAAPGANTDWRLIQHLLRQGDATLADAACQLGESETVLRERLAALVAKGNVVEMRTDGEVHYRARLARRAARGLPAEIWQAIGAASPLASRPEIQANWLDKLLDNSYIRFVVLASPAIALFGLVEWLLVTHRESFTGIINFGGVITASIFAGIFPVLLLLASRRRGDVRPGMFFGFLGHPLVIASIWLIFLGGLLAHGLFIWQDPLQRGAAMAAAAIVTVVSAAAVRSDAFQARAVLELRHDVGQAKAQFNIMVGGAPVKSEAHLKYADSQTVETHDAGGAIPNWATLCCARFQFSPAGAHDLKVWVHQVTPGGDSEPMPIQVEAHIGTKVHGFDLGLASTSVVLPLPEALTTLEITVSRPAGAA